MSIVPMYTDRAWRLGARWRCRVGLQKTWKTSRILRMRPRKLAHASTMVLRLTLAGATIATGFWMKGAGLVAVVGLAAESEAPCGTTGLGNVAMLAGAEIESEQAKRAAAAMAAGMQP